MNKTFYEKVRDFFINMGKHHRLLLPLAVVGLAVTMLISNFCHFCKKSVKRFACTAVILCLFFLGNSFCFPTLYSEGFVSKEEAPSDIAANTSDISLINDENLDLTTVDEDDAIISEVFSEQTVLNDDEIASLDDILNNVDVEDADGITDEEEKGFDASDWRLTLINKQHPIPDDYEFTLGTLSGAMQCDSRIISELLNMMKAAKEDGVNLVICSPYRDLSRQEMLFDRKIEAYLNKGYTYMEAYKLSSQAVTVPGASEHQVGLAIDLITDNYTTLDEGFENTAAGIWLKEHCDEFGFILRYPKDKEFITSIEYEPWHFRYVGKEAAKVIMEENLCLEEFWEKYL